VNRIRKLLFERENIFEISEIMNFASLNNQASDFSLQWGMLSKTASFFARMNTFIEDKK
jgi:hypothetical protein